MQNQEVRIWPAMKVDEAIRLYPATLAVFHEFGIEACCGAGKPIGVAAERHGVDAARLLQALNGAAPP